MKKQTVLKKLLASIMVAIIVLGQFSAYRLKSKAVAITGGEGPIYISLSKTNENGNGYAFGMNADGSLGRTIWNMMVSTKADQSDKQDATNVYCIKADYGQSWESNISNAVKYNKNYSVPLTQETESETANNVLFGEYKNEILWIIDNLYVPGESKETDFTKYLNNAGIFYDDYDEAYSYIPTEEHDYTSFISSATDPYIETVTEEDILALQQAVIWYYTNYGENGNVYDKAEESPWLQYTNLELLADTTGKNKYPELITISEGKSIHATIIYNYLINQAKKVADELGNNEYKLKNSTVKLWLSISDEGTANNEQPVIEVHKIEEKPFDLSLRKAIVKIENRERNIKEIFNANGEVADRNLNENGSIKNVDTATLNPVIKATENETTAIYKHRKDPVVVETGDTVTYSITIYNESEEAGYANKIVDQLPGTWGNGLRLENNQTTVTSTTGNIYNVEYVTSTNTIKLTMAENSPKNVLEPFNTETETLESETVLLQCKVMGKADSASAKVLTNIAYISEAYNAYHNEIITQTTTQDRDSKTWEYPQQTSNNLITTDIGYTGKNNVTELSKNDTYYEGQEDDDDFEKIIILPKSFDLSLRKNITKVTDANGEEKDVEDRTPNIEKSELNVGTKTTAEYKHKKDAVAVENGDIVEYNISLYNEGSIDGVATIVRDQLPVGLKLNLDYFDKEGKKYFATSSKGNIYEVTYIEESNLGEFKLDKTKTTTLKYLSAYKAESGLDADIINLQCKVEYTADDTQNTYLTNIAYIYEAEQVDGTVVTEQTSGSDADRDSQPHTYPTETAEELTTVGNIGYTGKEEQTDLSNPNKYYEGKQDEEDFEKLVILPKTFDLKLIKFVTEVNDEPTNNRVIDVDTTKLNTTSEETTAEYILEKNSVGVKAGDFVTYTLRIYNEGNYDGYATEISESIPVGLEFIVVTDGAIFSWDGTEQKDITEEIKNQEIYNKIIEINSNWGYSQTSSIITTRALSEDLIKGFGQEGAQYADAENKIDYKEVSVIFRVKEDIEPNIVIRNEAAISGEKVVDNEGNEINVPDRDSSSEEWEKKNLEKTYDEEAKWPIYEEDDEDYDNIITKSFDLSLRKQVTKINNALYTNRFSKLDENNTYSNTLYDYYNVYNNKLKVKAGDIIVYSIKVYNEGEIDGYASLIVDKLPAGLEFIKYEQGDGSINDKYGWTLVEGTENLYQTDYLSYEKDVNKGTSKSTIIKAYSGEGEADYEEVYIECRVKEDVTPEDSLLNVAQIAEDSDEDGEPIRDRDSVTGTSDDEEKWKNEDDLDIEVIQLQEFDLALRKFITRIENSNNTIEEIATRIPQVSYDEETKQIKYTHEKDALVAHVGDTIIYTLRVYNEGDIDGYASEIKDDIPEYLEYLPEHETNIENGWVMYDEEGNETEDVKKAVFVKTEHLAKGHGLEGEDSEGSNLIKAFNPEEEISETNPHYKEVEVAFKIKDPKSTEYEIINFAQISEDTDLGGNPIKDKDSETDNGEGEPKEDDENLEKVKVEYFDLSLLKYVTKVLVNENGQERIIETGNVGDENDIIPHVQINKKNIDNTIIKFVYAIKVTNEGQIPGEATEITDYVPEGLKFVEEDNQYWTDEGNNIISTKQLTGSTLQPGESAEVEVVLRWINGEDNLGPKTNIPEISEDYNEEGVLDQDSIPDNKKDEEDEIDNATVLISINQGGGIPSIYMNLAITFLGIILVGGIAIKKFVL